MSDLDFDSPVFVREHEGFIREISHLDDAIDFLERWPKHRRGMIYDTALRACRRVHEDGYPLWAARGAIEGFAKSCGILEEPDMPPAWMAPRNGRSGGATA